MIGSILSLIIGSQPLVHAYLDISVVNKTQAEIILHYTSYDHTASREQLNILNKHSSIITLKPDSCHTFHQALLLGDSIIPKDLSILSISDFNQISFLYPSVNIRNNKAEYDYTLYNEEWLENSTHTISINDLNIKHTIDINDNA